MEPFIRYTKLTSVGTIYIHLLKHFPTVWTTTITPPMKMSELLSWLVSARENSEWLSINIRAENLPADANSVSSLLWWSLSVFSTTTVYYEYINININNNNPSIWSRPPSNRPRKGSWHTHELTQESRLLIGMGKWAFALEDVLSTLASESRIIAIQWSFGFPTERNVCVLSLRASRVNTVFLPPIKYTNSSDLQ